MLAKDIMTTDVLTVQKNLELRKLAELFVEKDISGAPVVDGDGNYCGLVLEEGLIFQDKQVHLPTFMSLSVSFLPFGIDSMENELKKIAATTVGEIIEKQDAILNPNATVEEVATLMVEKGLHYFVVLDDGELVGVVTKKDIVKAIAEGKIH